MSHQTTYEVKRGTTLSVADMVKILHFLQASITICETWSPEHAHIRVSLPLALKKHFEQFMFFVKGVPTYRSWDQVNGYPISFEEPLMFAKVFNIQASLMKDTSNVYHEMAIFGTAKPLTTEKGT